MSTPIRRHFTSVGSRRVHYRSAGSGPPLVMLHGSPGDTEMLEHEMLAAAAHFTVIAIDTPGFGHSEALPGDTLTVRDLAEATAEAITTLGLPPCRVFGTHTGAAIAIELGVGWPSLVTGLVMEGLPAFTEPEMEILFRGYFAPMVPDPLGGHLTSTWIRFRDQFTWFPWPSRDVTRLNPYGRPSPEDIHHWVAMFYRSCRTYGPAYRAACFYGQRALLAAEALTLPAVFTATVEDMLHPHLARLPPLRPHQRIAPLPSALAEKSAALVAYLRELPGEDAPFAPPAGLGGMQFLDTSDGQIFVRFYGDRTRPALLIAHEAPGSGLAAEPLARALAGQFFVVLPDLPGCGDSPAPAQDSAILAASAAALRAVVDHLALPSYAVLGLGCGAAVAATLVQHPDPRLSAILVDSPPVPDEAIAQNIAPDLPLSPEGAHWVRAWLMVRDGQIYQPWFDGSVAAQRRTQGIFDAQFLHDQTCALMSARTTYHRLPRAAWRFNTEAALAAATCPVHRLAPGDTARLVTQILDPEF